MANIYDVAKAAKVSPATVSRVINGRPGVREETIQRIRKIMDSSAFQPRWKAIDRNRLLVLLPEHRGALESGYISRILSGICDVTFASGFGIQMQPFIPQIRNNKELRQLVMREGVAGCIIITMFQGYAMAEKLGLTQTPHAIVGYKSQDDGVHQILLDDYQAGMNAARYLLSLGHRKIAMVSFKHVDHGHQQRFAGYAAALRDEVDANPPVCVEVDSATVEDGRSAARRLLSLPDRPTAAIITNEDLAVGFQSEARNMDIRVPRDLSIIGFEESDTLAYLDTPMTAMHIPAQAMGMEAAKMVFGQMTSKSEDTGQKTPIPTHSIHLPISLVARHSTQAVE
ncbi:LacI family transcriptional regulator [Termitidicoccus mucosus]|uniref:Transcriptional regulator n=1 Tax=Termitidicoccus mucosus TaxID=1184151 RepID=A0A178IMX3_9BACT|nr:transcriptional regulator [Opitutaceae bacterium TSB47]